MHVKMCCLLISITHMVHAGAYGCTISGAGPTCIAIVDDPLVGRQVAEAMAQAFEQQGNLSINFARVVQLDTLGAQTLSYT